MAGQVPVKRNRFIRLSAAAGALITTAGQPRGVIGFTISSGKIVEIDAIADRSSYAGST